MIIVWPSLLVIVASAYVSTVFIFKIRSFEIFCNVISTKDYPLLLPPISGKYSSVYRSLYPRLFIVSLISRLITFGLNTIGWAEASYTFSQVTIPGEYDYRIARGFSSGISHVLSFPADFRIGKYFSVRGMYRGEFRKKGAQKEFDNKDNVFSMEMKAFL